MGKEVKVGDFAPDFTLKDQHGDIISLSDYRDKANVVLYFYPKDDTPGCTAQACSFRDHFEDFKDHHAVVIGVSSDDETSHVKFASKHNLPFTLLSDHDAKVRKLYGVPKSFLFVPGRLTYIIDKKGVVVHVFNSQLQFGKHTDEALRVLDELD